MNRVHVVAALLLSSAIVFGQTSLATVTGTVTDTTGAVIAEAAVTLRNLENGAEFKTTSSTTGNYTISQVPIGDYDLNITSPGFKTYAHTKFHLGANQTFREDVPLEVGQSTESVTVTSEATLLQTDSSELVRNVTLTQMNNMPLLNIGVSSQGFRDPFSAVRLMPGVRYAQATTSNTMVINGTGGNSQQVRLDGQTAGTLSANLIGATGQNQPSVDAIEEVSVQASNFAAEFGTSGGAVINMVTKSGTNQYHGGVYDYMRNEALDAHQPYTGNRNKVRQHDWGFTGGGPVKIPWLYDGTNKTFFFWSYEQFRNKQVITTASTTVPTPAYRNGDFSNLILQENRLVTRAVGTTSVPVTYGPNNATIPSGTIFDPASDPTFSRGYRDPFPGNQIPLSRFDKTSVKILTSYVPLPFGVNADRGQAGNNYQAPYDQSRLSQIPSIKIDQNIGSKNRLSFYLQETKTKTPRSATGADNYPDTITASVSSFSAATTARLNWDWTVSPRLLLHFGAGWNDIDFLLSSPVTDYDAMKELGLRQAVVRNFPQFGVGSSGAALGGMSNLGTASQSSTFERRPAGNVSANYVIGGHTFKAGAEYRLEKYPSYNYANTAGTYTFGTAWTTQTALQGITTNVGFNGFALASFLLGGFNSMTMAAPTSASTSKSQTSIYIQDNWKAMRKLTIDYGVRWDYGTYAREQYGRYSSFSPFVPNPAASGRLGARAFEATCNCNFASNYPYAIGPRVGAAYQMDRKTVLRAGIGIVYDSTTTASGGPVNTAFSANPTNFGAVLGQLQDGTPSYVNPVWPNFDPAAGQAAGSVIVMPLSLDPHAGRPSRLVQWNLTLQREITRDFVIEAAYVANRGVWLEANGFANLNNLSQQTLKNYGITNFTDTNLGRVLSSNYPTGTTAQNIADRATLAQYGITGLPYANYPTSSQLARNSLNPFPQYSGQSVNGAPLGNSWYDSFQLTLNKRFSHGLQFNVNYNYSKNLSLTSSSDPYNRRIGKNLDAFDLPNQLRLTLLYQIPQTRNLNMPVLSNKYVSYLVSDWGLGAYLNYQSASLLARPSSTGTTPINQFLGYGPGGAQMKEGANPWSVDWTDYDGVHHTDPIDVNCHCFDPTKNVLLNPAAWSNIPDGQFGAQQQSIRWFRGIRIPTESANLSRNFRFGKESRFNLNVRVEFQNIFNRMQLPQPSTGGNFANNPTKFTSGANIGLYSGGFGTINPTSGTGGQRTGTFVGRFTF